MSRLFDGVDDVVIWGLGSCNLTGAYTLAAVVKLDAGVSWQSYLSNEDASTSRVAFGRHSSGELTAVGGGGAQYFINALSHSNADGWMLIAITKAAGTTAPKMHKYPIGGSPTHQTALASGGNGVTQAGGNVRFGEIDGSDFFKGRLAVAAEFTTALSDADIESLVTTFTRANWLALGAVGLWDEIDAFTTDHTGNGASRTSLVGTTDDADDPTGWAGWAGAAAEAPPPNLVMAPYQGAF